MKILFTGTSSFTGMWFIHELSQAGHHVVATLQQPTDQYTGVRQKRVQRLQSLNQVELLQTISFGDDAFLEHTAQHSYDVLCHHAADVTDYKNRDFDFSRALANNTMAIDTVLKNMKGQGLKSVVLTGSVFENDEGIGSGDNLAAFNPYGLSKGLTYQVFRYFSAANGVPLGKFVIPNPFGAYEEPRFTHYLVKNWFQGNTPSVNTPDYVRDNIQVELLAKVYAKYVAEVFYGRAGEKLNPSGYVESQGAFAQRFATEMQSRLKIPCPLDLKVQTEFSEPLMRINHQSAVRYVGGFHQEQAWDDIAAYYQQLFA